MSETKHAELPWDTTSTADDDRNNYEPIDAKNCSCLVACCEDNDDALNRANAAFIVKACNAHDGLLAACKQGCAALEPSFVTTGQGAEGVRIEAARVMREAIAKAEKLE